jgi:hypothetical protein
MLFLKNKKEMMIQPGRLARKTGVSKPKLISELRRTGLIHKCVRDEKGWLWIPWSVAIELVGAESLAVEPKRRKTPRRKKKQDDFDREVEELFRPSQPPQFRSGYDKRFAELERHSKQVAEKLVRAGVTIEDILTWRNKMYPTPAPVHEGSEQINEKSNNQEQKAHQESSVHAEPPAEG